MTKPIGYEALCNALLDGGVTSKQIIKHRFLLQAIAAQARTLPVQVITDTSTWGFDLVWKDKTWGIALDNLSTKTSMHRVIRAQSSFTFSADRRAAVSNISDEMLWLYPLEFTRFERLRIWLEQKWIALKVWCGKIRNR
jgi:hypothetical protein